MVKARIHLHELVWLTVSLVDRLIQRLWRKGQGGLVLMGEAAWSFVAVVERKKTGRMLSFTCCQGFTLDPGLEFLSTDRQVGRSRAASLEKGVVKHHILYCWVLAGLGTVNTISRYQNQSWWYPWAWKLPRLGCFKMQKVKISRWRSPKIGYYTKLSHCKRNWDFSCKIVAPRNFFVFNGDFGFF